MIRELVDMIIGAIRWLRSYIHKVINGILNFAQYVVGYFRNLNLQQGRDVPFLADAESFKSALKKAPTKDVGIFQGTYNEQTDDIENARYVEADNVDQKTRQTLGNEKLVVLA